MKPTVKPIFLIPRTVRTLALIAAIGGVGVLVSGCASRVESRGISLTDTQIASVEPGSSNRDDVLSALGSPSNASSFGGETWYYFYEKDESFAFFETEAKERQVLALSFDESGKLMEKKVIGLDEAQAVAPIERKTPTAGNKMSFIEQMIANIGRFGK